MRFLLIFVFVPCALSQDKEIDLILKLKDGTVFSTSSSLQSIELKTDFGSQKIPLKDVKWVKAEGDKFRVKTVKSTFRGALVQESFVFQTTVGKLTLKPSDIQTMTPGKNRMGVLDENVVGYWDFAGDEEELKLKGASYEQDEDRTVLKLDLSKDDHVEIPHKEELSMKEQATIEMWFKYSDKGSGGNYINLLRKGPGVGQQVNYEIWLQPSSKLFQLDCHGENNQMAYTSNNATNLKPNNWHYFVYVVNYTEKKISMYLDGDEVKGTQYGTFDKALKNNDSPISICKDRYGNGNTVWIDMIRISSKARTQEEIRELMDVKSVSIGKQKVDKEYPATVVLKTGERFNFKFDSKTLSFESRFGQINVPCDVVGKLDFFQYRKEEIGEIHKEAKKLIPKLGDDDPTTRDNTDETLKKMGWVILPVLEENKEAGDPEIRMRILNLISILSAKEYKVEKDRIYNKGFFLRGWVNLPKVTAKSRYGDITATEKQIKVILFGSTVEKKKDDLTIQLTDGTLVTGTVSVNEFELVSGSDIEKISAKKIIQIKLGSPNDKVTATNGIFKGSLKLDKIEIDSQIGKLSFKKEEIAAILNVSYKQPEENKN